MKPRMLLAGLTALAVGWLNTSVLAQCENLDVTDTSTDEVLDGVELTWDSSYHCLNAPTSGNYSITVEVSNDSDSVEAVRLTGIAVSHTTPRAGRLTPGGTANTADLPQDIAPGQSIMFEVTGTYSMVDTDEGQKANLHLRVAGFGLSSGDSFALGINVHIRGPGATE
jgi:hypothetical protein